MAKTCSISLTLVERLAVLLTEVQEKRQECEQNGHKSINWKTYNQTSKSSYFDKVGGRCNYCGDNLERTLNDDERRKLDDFYNSLNNQITI